MVSPVDWKVKPVSIPLLPSPLYNSVTPSESKMTKKSNGDPSISPESIVRFNDVPSELVYENTFESLFS